MGACIAHPHDILVTNLPEEASILVQQEREFQLNEVDFNMYWSQVKLVGYAMKLNAEHMKEIGTSINLDYEGQIISNKNQYDPVKVIFCDKQFGFADGQHDPQKLLMIGFLYCKFDDPLQHIQELWFMINPQFKTTVPRSTIRTLIKDLLHISIDQRIKILSGLDGFEDQKRYLSQCEALKDQFIDLMMAEFGDSPQVSRTQFSQIITPPFTRTYSLRGHVMVKCKEGWTPKPNPNRATLEKDDY